MAHVKLRISDALHKFIGMCFQEIIVARGQALPLQLFYHSDADAFDQLDTLICLIQVGISNFFRLPGVLCPQRIFSHQDEAATAAPPVE